MPSDLFRNEVFSRIQTAIVRAKDAGLLQHPGLTGRAREVFVKDLLKPLLPPYVEIGTGKISDSDGNLSAEVDVIIYSAATLPAIIFDAGFGIFPADACVYAVEVKSVLTADQLRDAIKKLKHLQQLRYLPSALDWRYQPAGPPCRPVIPALFAFGSDLTNAGKGEIDRYRELDLDADTNPTIPVLCVAGRGYWWYKPNEPAEKWINHLPTENNEEILDFLGGVANTIPDVVAQKGRPRIGQYFLRPRDFKKL
ncbi:MAG: hypothetical protein HRU82_02420 [Nitrospira sp.]|nr:MAG: hypothetical protein HRU82_02420 [Nitrospira sp.]